MVSGGGRTLSRARVATLVSLSCGVAATLFLPATGLAREPHPWRVAAGAVGFAVFAVVLAVALRAAATPVRSARSRRRLRIAYATVAVLGVPLVAPVAVGAWPTAA